MQVFEHDANPRRRRVASNVHVALSKNTNNCFPKCWTTPLTLTGLLWLPVSCEFASIFQKHLNKNLGDGKKKKERYCFSSELIEPQKRKISMSSPTCDWSITSQRSVLFCMSCPLRGSRSRIFTSTRPPVGLRPSITCQEQHLQNPDKTNDNLPSRLLQILKSWFQRDAAHLYDFPDLTQWLQFVQLHQGRADWLVAPQETSVRRHNRKHHLHAALLSWHNRAWLVRDSSRVFYCFSSKWVASSATHPLCSSSSLSPFDVTTLLKPRWFRLIDSVKLWLYSGSGKSQMKATGKDRNPSDIHSTLLISPGELVFLMTAVLCFWGCSWTRQNRQNN